MVLGGLGGQPPSSWQPRGSVRPPCDCCLSPHERAPQEGLRCSLGRSLCCSDPDAPFVLSSCLTQTLVPKGPSGRDASLGDLGGPWGTLPPSWLTAERPGGGDDILPRAACGRGWLLGQVSRKPNPFLKGDLIPRATDRTPPPQAQDGVSCPVFLVLRGHWPCGQVQGQQSPAPGEGALGTLPPSARCTPSLVGSKGHCPDFYCRLWRSHDPLPSSEPGRREL